MAEGFWGKTLNFLGFGSEPDLEDEIGEVIQKKQKKRSNVFKLSTSMQSEIVVIEPSSFEEVQTVADSLKLKQAVVVNLQSVDNELSRRVVDFLSGIIYAIDGNLQRVSEDIFLFTPQGVEIISAKSEDKESKLFFSGR